MNLNEIELTDLQSEQPYLFSWDLDCFDVPYRSPTFRYPQLIQDVTTNAVEVYGTFGDLI